MINLAPHKHDLIPLTVGSESVVCVNVVVDKILCFSVLPNQQVRRVLLMYPQTTLEEIITYVYTWLSIENS